MSEAVLSYDKEAIRAALPLVEVVMRDGVELRASGVGKWVGRCPFHTERSPSFLVDGKGRFHCFGCGVGGDVFDFWARRRGLDVKVKEQWGRVLAELAGLAGIGPRVGRAKLKFEKVPEFKPASLEERGRPWLPKMRLLRRMERQRLASLRGVSVEAVEVATGQRRVGFSLWPLLSPEKAAARAERMGKSVEEVLRADRGWPSWVVTDDARWCAQWRRLDGLPYVKRDGDTMKSWSTRNTGWVVGCGDIGHRGKVWMVEGGADLLAALHLLCLVDAVEDVAVCCVFGASNSILPECFPAFAGKRVRILADNDEPKARVRGGREVQVKPGMEAALRWQKQLLAAGAQCVETVDLSPLGRGIKDVNDWVKAGARRADVARLAWKGE